MDAIAMKNNSAKEKSGAQHSYVSDEQRWNALVRRERNAEGKFFYSVNTTGIYCRPACAAPLPRRENVRFHTSCEEAEKAGFRPCKRCQPHGSTLVEQYTATVAKACRIMTEIEETPSLEFLARSVGMSRFHFHRVFTKL